MAEKETSGNSNTGQLLHVYQITENYKFILASYCMCINLWKITKFISDSYCMYPVYQFTGTFLLNNFSF